MTPITKRSTSVLGRPEPGLENYDAEDTDLFALLCERRGWDSAFFAELNTSEHADLKDLDTMAQILERVRLAGAEITIAPDFDMDGISSGILGYAGLKELGFQVNLQIPDYTRGHDLTPADIDEIAQLFPGTQVLLTCDGGVNSHAGVRAAKKRGWVVLVTDHHEELAPGSEADITVDPCRIDETYQLRGICGAHVLYQVIERYAATYRPDKEWEIQLLRLFAGIGTVGDVMPVIRENRKIIQDSLSIARLLRSPAPFGEPNQWGDREPVPEQIQIQNAPLLQLLAMDPGHDPAFVNAFRGFGALLKAFSVAGKLQSIEDLDEEFYGFFVAPAMNAPRRTGVPINDCFEIFLSGDESEQLAAMERVIENNNARKELTVTALKELDEQDQPFAPWVFFSDAYPGMLGLLANELMSREGHVVVVLNRPQHESHPASGSARAPEWYPVITSLEGSPDFWAVGHQQACGVKLTQATAIADLCDRLETTTSIAMLSRQVTVDGPASGADLVLGRDAECDGSVLDQDSLMELVERIRMLKPFGQGFNRPVMEIRIEPIRIDRIGSEKQHLRFILGNGMAVLWWGAAEQHADRLKKLAVRAQSRRERCELRFLAKLQVNTFRDEVRVQAVVETELEHQVATP